MSSNALGLNFMRVPILTNLSPAKIYNLASVKGIKVIGRDFYNSERLICQIAGKHTVRAIFKSENSLLCPVSNLWGLGALSAISIQISNDKGNTFSNTMSINVVIDLP